LPLLRGVDGIAQWGFILNNTNARPGPLHISDKCVLHWPYKLVMGRQPYSAWQGALYPNCSTVASSGANTGPTFIDIAIFNSRITLDDNMTWMHDCGEGCLFDVSADPAEHNDLAGRPEHADRLARMQDTLRALNKDLFLPGRGHGTVDACMAFIDNGGYYGPFQDIHGWYSPRPTPTSKERLEDAALRAVLRGFDHEGEREGLEAAVQAGIRSAERLGLGLAMDSCAKKHRAGAALLPEPILV